MEYKGYRGSVYYDDEEETFVGHVVNLPKGDAVLIRGSSVDALRKDLAAQIDVYEDNLRAHGREPAPVG